MSKEVAEAKDNLPSTDVMSMFEEHEGEGLDYDTSELQIPFIRIAQATSDQVKKKSPKYIEGLSVGDIYNTVTGKYYDGEKGVILIPCYQETVNLKFIPRSEGGGFLGILSPDDPEISKAKRTGSLELLPDGNELIRSDQHYCLVIGEDGVPNFGIVDMKKTSLTMSRKWKSMLSMLTIEIKGVMKRPPIFLTKWKLSVVEDKNDKGDWCNHLITSAGYLIDPDGKSSEEDKELANMALNFRKSVVSGEAKAVAEDVVTEIESEEPEQHSAF